MMTLARALELIHAQQAAIGLAACQQNPAALEVQASSALFRQKPNTKTAARLTQAVENWQQYRAENPLSEV